jgi:hypothetical protein
MKTGYNKIRGGLGTVAAMTRAQPMLRVQAKSSTQKRKGLDLKSLRIHWNVGLNKPIILVFNKHTIHNFKQPSVTTHSNVNATAINHIAVVETLIIVVTLTILQLTRVIFHNTKL